MKLFVTFLFAVLLSFPAYAGARKGDCEHCLSGPPTGLAPAVPDEICAVAQHDMDEWVQLKLYRADGSIRRQPKRFFKASEDVSFCLGPQWFNDETVHVKLCGHNHSVRNVPEIREARQSRVLKMCLLGDERCPRFVK